MAQSKNGVRGTSWNWGPGSEVVAVYAFSGNSEEDLQFKKDDVLKIVGLTKDPNWFLAERSDGTRGMVPVNYVAQRKAVSPSRMPFFHGRISREEAEASLEQKPDGTYLVRESTNFPGDYTLCLAYKGKVEHYRIHWKSNRFLTCDDEEFFETLPELVAHYEEGADGLCHKLTLPVVKGGKMGRDLPDRAPSITPANQTIPSQHIQFGETIGRGEFADVLIGMYNGKKVAVKILKGSSQNGELRESVQQEAGVMSELRHKNLVRLLGVVLDGSSNLCMVTEFMPNGNLVDYLRSRGRHQVTPSQQISFACDVCEGMEYLEAQHLVHRDLAARNVLLAEDMTAKVSDFGLAKHDDRPSPSEDASGKFPIKWTAPEALRFSKFSSKSDVWSFGVLLWEIYSFGRVPYPRIPIQDVVRHIEKGYRMEPLEGCPPEITELMNQAWAFKAENRPTFRQMLVKLNAIEAAARPPS